MNSETVDWIALNLVRGIGPRTAYQLIRHYHSPAAALSAPAHELLSLGVRSESIEELHSSEVLSRADAEIERAEALGAAVITLDSPQYPPLLREIPDPPIVLYCKGQLASALSRPVIAIVGSRRCSTYGSNSAAYLSRELAAMGICIVSGLARGIDTAAHRGALEKGGTTLAIIGTGIDLVYPAENRKLFEQICESGAVLTEFPLATPPLAQNFPYRNRVISGLSLGVLVVEAAEHSGSLITARLATEQGREVFAVPGNITSRNSFGPNFLIKDGAKLVQYPLDVLEELPAPVKKDISLRISSGPATQQTFAEFDLSPHSKTVLDLMSFDSPVLLDQLLTGTGLGYSVLMSALLDLAMKDRITELPGKRFIKRL